MGPSSFFTPERSEMVANRVIGRLRERFLLPASESIVALGNLPDCGRTEKKLANLISERKSWRSPTMRVNRYSFSPAKTHQAYTIRNLRPNTLELQEFLMSISVSLFAL